MKRLAVISVSILLALSITGCAAEEKPFDAEPVRSAAPAQEDTTIGLSQVVGDNAEALGFAGDQIDFLEGDKFLGYVNEAKDRDEEARQKAALAALSAQIQALQ